MTTCRRPARCAPTTSGCGGPSLPSRTGPRSTYQLPYGDWIRLFRANGLVVEDLIELRPPEDADTTYVDYAPLEWARAFPGEHIWKVRKAPDAGELACGRPAAALLAVAVLVAAALDGDAGSCRPATTG